MEQIEISSEITTAESLPSGFYTSDEYFEASKQRIFSRTWQFAGLRQEVDNVLPVTLLEPMLSEPLLITYDGAPLCLSNVCTHRANILVEKKCRIEGIRCRYHGRRFDLRGKFLSMPEFEGVQNFPSKQDDLKQVPAAEWAGLVFVSLNPVDKFKTFFAPVLDRFGNFGNGASVSIREYHVKAHWALYCENFLEGFHIPFVHNSLNQELDFSSYEISTSRYSSLQTAKPAAEDPELKEDLSERESAAYYYFVFPNLMFNFYAWGLSVNVVEPISKERTRVRYVTMVTDPSKRNEGAGGDLETVEFEDQRIVESVQAGIRSTLYDRGRYSVRREAGLHHFHRLIAEFMNNRKEI